MNNPFTTHLCPHFMSHVTFTFTTSPWVCNCGHPWAMHQQRVVHVQPSALLMAAMAAAEGGFTPEVMATVLDGMQDVHAIEECRPDGL